MLCCTLEVERKMEKVDVCVWEKERVIEWVRSWSSSISDSCCVYIMFVFRDITVSDSLDPKDTEFLAMTLPSPFSAVSHSAVKTKITHCQSRVSAFVSSLARTWRQLENWNWNIRKRSNRSWRFAARNVKCGENGKKYKAYQMLISERGQGYAVIVGISRQSCCLALKKDLLGQETWNAGKTVRSTRLTKCW